MNDFNVMTKILGKNWYYTKYKPGNQNIEQIKTKIIEDITQNKKLLDYINEQLINDILQLLNSTNVVSEKILNNIFLVLNFKFRIPYQNNIKTDEQEKRQKKEQEKRQKKEQEKRKKDEEDKKTRESEQTSVSTNMTSTEIKNLLTENDIKILYKKDVSITELENYLQSIKGDNSDQRKSEFKRKIEQLEIKIEVTEELNEQINSYKFKYDSQFQFTNVPEIQDYQDSNSNSDITVEINDDMFDKFSELNIGLFPKLISIMLNPEKFCLMWYNNINFSKNAYSIINFILNTFFIKCYSNVAAQIPNSFTTVENSVFIKRDTQLFKSMLIQNLLLLCNKLILNKKKEEGVTNSMHTDYKCKIIFNLIMKKINEIKDDNKTYIFNYKLLNEFKIYQNKIIIANIIDKTYDINNSQYEVLLELQYYYEQLNQSLVMLAELSKSFETNKMINFLVIQSVSSHESLSESRTSNTKIIYKNFIEEQYMELIGNYAQVLTYVKERNDATTYGLSNEVNPRYNIKLSDAINSNIPCNYPIQKQNNVGLKFYDFQIKYFNYPHVIGLTNNTESYYDPSKKLTDTNFQINNAKKFVTDHPKYIETYKLGKINRYYGNNITSEEIADDPECGKVLLQKLRNFEDIIIIGNGQSGAGKTASLISRTTNGKYFPGLLPSISNKLINPESTKMKTKAVSTSRLKLASNDYDDADITYDINDNITHDVNTQNIQYFESATVKLINLYLKLDDNLNDINDMTQDHYLPYNIKLLDESGNELNVPEYTFNIQHNKWVCTNENSKQGKLLDQIIAEAFEIREAEPTKNNPNSSRSHIIVCITFTGQTKLNTGIMGNKEARIVICDLAGVEDKFSCDLKELVLLDRNYTEKSDKYKITEPFINKKKQRYDTLEKYREANPETRITFDNFFCDEKYLKDNLFPDKLFDNKKKLVDDIVQLINQYYDINKGNDPVNKQIKTITDEFKREPINERDNDHVNQLILTAANLDNDLNSPDLFTPYTLQSISYPIDTFDFAVTTNTTDTSDFDVTSNATDTSVITKCNIISTESIEIINNFMLDFTKLPDGTNLSDTSDINVYGNFEVMYQNETNTTDVKNKIIDKIKNFINSKPSKLFSTEDTITLNTPLDKISEINILYNINKQKIIDDKAKLDFDYTNEKSDVGKNHNEAIAYVTEQSSLLKNDTENLDEKLNKNIYLDKLQTLYTIKNSTSGGIPTVIPNIIILTDDEKTLINEFIKEYGLELLTVSSRTVSSRTVSSRPVSSRPVMNYRIIVKLSSDYNLPLSIMEEVSTKINKEKDKLISENDANNQEKTRIETIQKSIDDNTMYNTKKTELDKQSLINYNINISNENEKLEKLKTDTINNLKLICNKIKNIYFNQLILHRFNKGKENINKYLNNDRIKDKAKIKYLIQQLIRFSQLEFNCLIRRKEGFMINTSLKEMQKFIGSILFESSKRRFNKVLIENNLLKMDNNTYLRNDYIKYNTRIIICINKIMGNLKYLKDNEKRQLQLIKERCIENCKQLKKEVLQYFTYVLNIVNGDQKNYKDIIDLSSLLIYLCFTDIIISVLTNDKINFNIIFYGLSNLGNLTYTQEYNNIFHLIQTNTLITTDYNNDDFKKINEIFDTLYKYDGNDSVVNTIKTSEAIEANKENIEKLQIQTNCRILNYFYTYSQITNIKTKYYIFNEILKLLFNGYAYTIENTEIKIVYDTNSKILLKASDDNFKNFYRDIINMWKVLQRHTTSIIYHHKKKIDEDTVKSSTFNLPTPLLYSSPSIDSCVQEKNKYDDEYDKFYSYEKNNNPLEILFRIMTNKSNTNEEGKKEEEEEKKEEEDEKKEEEENEDVGQEVISKIPGFGVNIANSTLIIFTVIDITPNPTAPRNNPPIPPFININKLKLIYKIITMPIQGVNTIVSLINKEIEDPANADKANETENADETNEPENADETNEPGNVKKAKKCTNIKCKIIKYFDQFKKKLSKYEFYVPSHDTFNTYLNWDKITETDGIKNLKEKVIDFIDSNNATTLIGTVDFEKFTKIRDPTQPYFICDGKNESLLKQIYKVDKILELLKDNKGTADEDIDNVENWYNEQ